MTVWHVKSPVISADTSQFHFDTHGNNQLSAATLRQPPQQCHLRRLLPRNPPCSAACRRNLRTGPTRTNAGPPPPKKRRQRKKQFPEMIRSAAAFAGLRVHRARKSTHGAVEIDDAPSKNRCPRRPSDLSKEDDTEALTPISFGCPVDSLTEEEIEANVVSQIGGAERANYIVVRNHILARWRSNVSIWLTRDHALDSIRLEDRSLVSSAYAFLLEHGYINFGLAPSISEAKSRPPEGGARASNTAWRPNTDEEDDRKKGGWGSGGGRRGRRGRAHRNQWQSTWELLQGNWSFHSIRVCKLRQAMMEEVKSADVSLGTPLDAFRHVYKDDPYEMGGDHYFIPGGNERYFIPGGNERFIRALAEDLPIFYDRRVESIRYEVDGVLVYANGQGYSSVSGGPLLVAGEAAIKFEKMSPVEAVERVLEILRGIFNPEWVAVPNPIQAVCTCSGQDQFTYGSYSYVAIGASGDDYGILSESIGDGRVFFAGEATNKQYPATMHGAFLSGMREAANILRVANRRSSVPAEKSNNVNGEYDDAGKLFETPDLNFGSFSVLFEPRSNDPESKSLLQVELRVEKLDSGCLHLYCLIQRKQAIELNEVDGDVNRMKLLNRDFRVRLIGRKSLQFSGISNDLH
ncbi:LSD1-like 1 [Actinidia rufa]|uniref:LSD1-like 1 n=1 Tax=Actinidia rufa TaxID=165716 RepID=A0A7J0EX48_9ERIC|nr:LSD1-like 1 [Actinidia rufa]